MELYQNIFNKGKWYLNKNYAIVSYNENGKVIDFISSHQVPLKSDKSTLQ